MIFSTFLTRTGRNVQMGFRRPNLTLTHTHFTVHVVDTFSNSHNSLSTELSKRLDTKNLFWF